MRHEKGKYFLVPAELTLTDEEREIYNSMIKDPRDLQSISEFLTQGKYSSISEFKKDVDLCFDNSKKFCNKRYNHGKILKSFYT
jgi:hypothetical protein